VNGYITEEGEWVLDRNILKAMLLNASKDETRPHLGCIRFEPAAGRMITTDGHCLAMVGLHTKHESAAFELPANALTTAIAGARRNVVRLVVGSNHVEVYAAPKLNYSWETEWLMVGRVPIRDMEEQPFPPWAAVVPAVHNDVTQFNHIGFDTTYIMRVEAMQKALSARGVRLQLEPGEGVELSPMRFDVCTEEVAEAYVIVMPMRV
jgi:hypothetical protein